MQGCDEPLTPLMLQGFAEFNRGEYFAQHETLEHAWMADRQPARALLQGILQLGLMCYHIRAGRYISALKMWQRSQRHLRSVPDVCRGVQVDKLRAAGQRMRDALTALGEARMAEFDPSLFPQVEWTPMPTQPTTPRLAVALGPRTMTEARQMWQAVADAQPDLAELRLDFFQEPFDLPALLAERPCPVIVTNRARREGGQWHGGEAERIHWLREAIAHGAEHIDMEADSIAALRDTPHPHTAWIVSTHDFQQMPADLSAVHRRLAGLGGDIVKVVGMAHSLSDALRALETLAAAPVPTIALAMSAYGVLTRVLALRSPQCYLSFVTLDGGGGTAPGQIAISLMRDGLQAKRLTPQTIAFGALGPQGGDAAEWSDMTARLRDAGLDAVYVPFKTADGEDMAANLRRLRALNVGGCRVEPPLQTPIAPLVRRDASAQKAGRVDTLTADGDGWVGAYTGATGEALAAAQTHLWAETSAQSPM